GRLSIKSDMTTSARRFDIAGTGHVVVLKGFGFIWFSLCSEVARLLCDATDYTVHGWFVQGRKTLFEC
ncbi:MAG: hypothetical protein MJZ81_12870, partial [Bacteroidales bacterium]|nr:hypothetical protein [Bacteroidales bacterium]